MKNVFTARSTISVRTRLARDNVVLNIKELDKNNMPRSGDVIVFQKDTTFGQVQRADSGVGHLEREPGRYSPVGVVRCGRVACRMFALKWKFANETGGKKLDDPHTLKSNEKAECAFLLSGLLCATPLMTARELRLFERLQARRSGVLNAEARSAWLGHK